VPQAWTDRAHPPRGLNCPACGAAFPADATRCAYCSSEITLEEKRLSEVCPRCHGRLAAGARYCTDCGIAIEPQALEPVPTERGCPRCDAPLRSRSLGKASVVECSSCGGFWLGNRAFESLCEEADQQGLALRALSEGAAPVVVPKGRSRI
jgi:hypothetical protein